MNHKCFRSFTPFLFGAEGSGALWNAYPNVTQIATFQYNVPLGIVGLVFTTSILQPNNVPAADAASIFLVYGTNATNLSITNTTQAIAAHTTQYNSSLPDNPNPSDQVTPIEWEDEGLYLPAGQSISLYGSASTPAGVLYSAYVSLHCYFAK